MQYLACDGELSNLGSSPSCSGQWISQSINVSDVDPALLSLAFGGGVVLYASVSLALFGFKILLRSIREF